MRVVVTGPTGFIGPYVIRSLVAAGHEAVALVRPSSDTTELAQLGVELAYGDITEKETVAAALHGADWLVHLANIYSFWERDKGLYTRVNVDGTRNVMEAALAAGVAKVIHVSTVLVFGKPADSPFHEGSAPGPQRFSEYAQTKYLGDQIVWELYQNEGLPVVVIYPAAVIGPGDRKSTGAYARDVVAGHLPGIPFAGVRLSLVDVRDVAEGILRALEQPENIGERYLLSAEVMTRGEWTRRIAAAAGVPAPARALPGWILILLARVATLLAPLTGEPAMGLALDSVKSAAQPFVADGSKATRELALTYRPVETAIADMVASFRTEDERASAPPDGLVPP
jgi:dihydroflavonol-4-reductase